MKKMERQINYIVILENYYIKLLLFFHNLNGLRVRVITFLQTDECSQPGQDFAKPSCPGSISFYPFIL